MKHFVTVLFFTLLLASSCQEDETPLDDERKARILIGKTWETAYVTLEGTDITDFGYSLMQLTFDQSGSWTSENSNDLFASSGSWQFATGTSGVDLTRISMSGKDVGIILNPEGSTLTMRFERTTNETIGGRKTDTGGTYELYLIPKFVPGD
jgi:hypothetical protein